MAEQDPAYFALAFEVGEDFDTLLFIEVQDPVTLEWSPLDLTNFVAGWADIKKDIDGEILFSLILEVATQDDSNPPVQYTPEDGVLRAYAPRDSVEALQPADLDHGTHDVFLDFDVGITVQRQRRGYGAWSRQRRTTENFGQ